MLLQRLCILLSVLSLPVAATAEPLAGDYGQPRLLVPSPDNPRLAHLSWPKIVRCPDGTLVVGYSAGRYHGGGGEGCPAVSISTDGGQNFSSPKILQEFTRQGKYDNCGNLAMGIADDGAVVLLAMAYTGNKDNTVVGWRSTDSGKTWPPVDTSPLADNQTGSVFGTITKVPGKGLVVFGHYRAPSKPSSGIWMAFSSDHGKTWGSPKTVTEKPHFEPSVTLAGERLVGLFRNTGGKPTRWYQQAVSDDMGQTWNITPASLAIPEGLPGSQPSPFVIADPDNPSKLYALQSIRGGLDDTRGRIYLWSADAQKLDWQRRGLVVANPKADMQLNDWTYPWMTPLGDGTWFLVFYAGNPRGANSIYGLTLKPE